MTVGEPSALPSLVPVERTISVRGHNITIRLESLLWEAFDELCQREQTTPAAFCAGIVDDRGPAVLSAAIAAFVAGYFRDASRNAVSVPGVALADALDAIGPLMQ